jgi:hypothetical protein
MLGAKAAFGPCRRWWTTDHRPLPPNNIDPSPPLLPSTALTPCFSSTVVTVLVAAEVAMAMVAEAVFATIVTVVVAPCLVSLLVIVLPLITLVYGI